MALVTSNSQSELTPLERGIHALGATEKGRKNGSSVKAYASAIGRPERSVTREVAAARVAASLLEKIASSPSWRTALDTIFGHMAEVHAAPKWLWPALVERLVADGWTVEATRKQSERLKAMSRLVQARDLGVAAGSQRHPTYAAARTSTQLGSCPCTWRDQP
jgi:hypothetical protein